MGHDNGELERLREGIRGRITMAEVCAKDGIQKARKEGAAVRARCPFHEEKSASFLIGGRGPHTAHCFGCNWTGDIFAYVQERKGLKHVEAVNELALLVGLAPLPAAAERPRVAWANPKAKGMAMARGGKRIEQGVKPLLPKLRMLRPEELQALAELRGLSVEGVRVAACTFRRVAACAWPLFHNRRQNRWMSPCLKHGFNCGMDLPGCEPKERWTCWVVTDESRWVAQFRRLDGELFPPRKARGSEADDAGDDEGFKSWTVGPGVWPVGAAEIGNRTNVILVEGGADMLAAYHFLFHFGPKWLNAVAVVCMLGVAYIAETALPFFRGKRVRIICDNDEEKIKITKRADGSENVKKTRPGADAAARWTEQLTAAGAAVKTFYLGDVFDAAGELVAPGLVTKEGKRVKDLNEAAFCGSEVIELELRDAFTEWKEGFGG